MRVFAVLLALLAQPVLAEPSSPGPELEEPAPDAREAFVPAKLDAGGKAIIAGLNRFGLELYGAVDRKGDLALSPASISTAFAIAFAGAKGPTAQEIAATLHYPAIADLHSSFGSILRTMDLKQNGRVLAVNNALWLQQELTVHPRYAALVERNYVAGLKRVDYKLNSEGARATINRWVESKTNDKIKDLLSSDVVTRDTRSVLVNTIYFKADWAKPFAKDDTKKEDFTLASGASAKRDLMHQQGDFDYAENAGVKALRLPYRGGETEMLLFLPDQPAGLAAFEQSLDAPAFEQWLKRLDAARSRVIVAIPKFTIKSKFELVPVLKGLGMRTPFSNQSDFSAMKVVKPLSPDQEDWNLKISNIIHQVFVEVEEKGTEAAAATAIVSVTITGARIPMPPKIFFADHPFLFMIRDRRTGAILFVGRFTGESRS